MYWKFSENKVANPLRQEKDGNLDYLASVSQKTEVPPGKVANNKLGNLDESVTQNSLPF